MPAFRVMSPGATPARAPVTCYGTTYASTPGQVLDVPDHHADLLGANGWMVLGQSGPTASRPTKNSPGRFAVQTGDEYYDTTLSKLVKFDGASWRDPATGSAV